MIRFVLFFSACLSAVAAPLSYTGVATVKDNNLSTFTNMVNGGALLLDLGTSNWVYRVFITGTNRSLQYWYGMSTNGNTAPQSIINISCGTTSGAGTNIANWTTPYDAGNPTDTEIDVRFNPVWTRYIRIEQITNAATILTYWPGFGTSPAYPTLPDKIQIAEVEIYGSAASPTNAVILDAPDDPLELAANDLSYYLSELTSAPVPIITSASTNLYSGKMFWVLSLTNLAPNYTAMMSNITAGHLVTNVNITVNGTRDVVFRSFPFRVQFWAVWEFLRRQGVAAVYPDGKGDCVPARDVDYSFLPLTFQIKDVFANWDVVSLQPWPAYESQSVRQSYLYPWRNFWTYSQNSWGPLGGTEVPTNSAAGGLAAQYAERFTGYPHNFNNVVPSYVLATNSTWQGYNLDLGVRTNAVWQSYSMNDTGLVAWVAGKALAVEAAYPKSSIYPLGSSRHLMTYSLLPMDAATYCSCPQFCAPTNILVHDIVPTIPWVYSETNLFSDSYWQHVDQVARLAPSVPIGGLAYADVYNPPLNLPSSFSPNVQIEIALYGAPNLSFNTTPNSAVKTSIDTFDSKASSLIFYDYALLHTDYWQTNMYYPVPLMYASLQRAQYLATIGHPDGGTQAGVESFPFNPWNYWAWPQTRWNTNLTRENLESFFTNYFAEAAEPMRRYYRIYEDNCVTNQANAHYRGYCYNLQPGMFPFQVLNAMSTNLSAAVSAATNWWITSRLTNMIIGFTNVVRDLGLTGTNLTDYSYYQNIGGGSSVTLNLSNSFEIPTPPIVNEAIQDSNGWSWEFLSVGNFRTRVKIPSYSRYTGTIRAKLVTGTPTLYVYVGPQMSSVTLTSTAYADYPINFGRVPAGVDDVRVYMNDIVGWAAVTNVTLREVRSTVEGNLSITGNLILSQ